MFADAMLDTVIIDRQLVAADRLAALQVRSDAPGLKRLFAHSSLYLLTGAALVLATDPMILGLCLLLNALVQLALFGMLHEACHRTAFRSRIWSEVAGWVAALAHPMSPALMRAFHFEHHRHTHELERDPELGGLPFMLNWPGALLWPMTMSGLPLGFARCAWMLFAALNPTDLGWAKVLPFVKADARSRIRWEARALLAIHGSAIATGFILLPAILRIYIGMGIAHALLSLYITCEHRGLSADGSILERTRSLIGPPGLNWLLWNMPYHAEHHAWPAVPFHALPALHQEVQQCLPHRQSVWSVHRSGGK